MTRRLPLVCALLVTACGASASPPALPLGPGVANVDAAVAEVSGDLTACAPGAGPVGAELLFRGATGALEAVSFEPGLDPALGGCLRAALGPVTVPRFADTLYRVPVTLELGPRP